MDKFGIQVNKTSRNTVLFMTNIGTTRSSIAYLIETLVKIAQDIEDHSEDMSPMERRIHEVRVASLTTDLPPLPDFSEFHRAFRHHGTVDTPEGNVRRAFFLAYDEPECEYFTLNQLHARVHSGHEIVSSIRFRRTRTLLMSPLASSKIQRQFRADMTVGMAQGINRIERNRLLQKRS